MKRRRNPYQGPRYVGMDPATGPDYSVRMDIDRAIIHAKLDTGFTRLHPPPESIVDWLFEQRRATLAWHASAVVAPLYDRDLKDVRARLGVLERAISLQLRDGVR